ncbi:ANTAR domain-containing protein [Longispora urticae]
MRRGSRRRRRRGAADRPARRAAGGGHLHRTDPTARAPPAGVRGACTECFRTGAPVAAPDLDAVAWQWPRFATDARAIGFESVHALPMRLRDDVIGALALFDTAPGALDADTLRLGQALADVATIGILQARAISHRESLADQLQTALNNRIIIEQAKGVLAERRHLDMDAAFTLLRTTARSSSRRLSELARAVVDGSETL